MIVIIHIFSVVNICFTKNNTYKICLCIYKIRTHIFSVQYVCHSMHILLSYIYITQLPYCDACISKHDTHIVICVSKHVIHISQSVSHIDICVVIVYHHLCIHISQTCDMCIYVTHVPNYIYISYTHMHTYMCICDVHRKRI